jgi:hypothetical protein
MIGSAEDERAEKIKKEVKSAVQRIAPLLKIDVTFNSGLLSEVYFYLSASCASPFFPMTRPLALRSLNDVSRGWGLASLMRCAERFWNNKTKKRV